MRAANQPRTLPILATGSRIECRRDSRVCRRPRADGPLDRAVSSARQRVRGDAGSYTVELVLWTPALALLIVVIVAAGRIVAAGSDATEASRDAARAASLQTTMPAAVQAAHEAARESFGEQGDTCKKLTVTVSGAVTPGGLLTVAVSCTVSLSDLAIPGAPGHRTLSATSTVPIETTRSGLQP